MQIIDWLDAAERELAQGEFQAYFNSLNEADYLFYAKSSLHDIDREVLGLINDSKSTAKDENYTHAMVYLRMANDVLSLPQSVEYQFNQTGLDSVEREIDELQATEIDVDDEMAVVQWHIDMRRLENKLMDLLLDDHKRRFSLN